MTSSKKGNSITNKSIPEKVLRWLLSGDTGLSSKAIVRKLMGYDKPIKGQVVTDDHSILEHVGNYPHDTDDLGRCIRLLEAVPEFKSRLKEMATVNKEWEGLV